MQQYTREQFVRWGAQGGNRRKQTTSAKRRREIARMGGKAKGRNGRQKKLNRG